MNADAKSVEEAIAILKRYFYVREYMVKNSFPLEQIISAGNIIALSVLSSLGVPDEEVQALDALARESSEEITKKKGDTN